MKKFLSIFMALVVFSTFAFLAVGSSDKKDVEDSNTETFSEVESTTLETPTSPIEAETVTAGTVAPDKFYDDITEPTSANNIPYTVQISSVGHVIYEEPSYSSDIVQDMPIGVFTIVKESKDDYGNKWGKLKSGLGWICLDEIQ